MKSVLLRAGSISICSTPTPGSPRVLFSVHDSIGGGLTGPSSPRISLRFGVNRRGGILRVSSESDVIGSDVDDSHGSMKLSGSRSRSIPSGIPQEEYSSVRDGIRCGSVGCLALLESGVNRISYARECPGRGSPMEQVGYPGNGNGNHGGFGGGPGGGGGDDSGASGSADQNRIGAYYLDMLKSNPSDPLLLRNYAKYLHEVERDLVKAEEYYGRAILASPGDGELLSLYGKLIWETKRDKDRAKSYFDQAVSVSPNDCTVMGSYAHFMWEAEEDVDEIVEEKAVMATAAVEAF